MSLTISIVLSVDVFLLCLIEIIPPTSFVVPLLCQYLLFTLCLVTVSVIATVYVLNISFRNASSHRMSKFQRKLFLECLPRLLLMKKRQDETFEEISKTKFVHCGNDISKCTCNNLTTTTTLNKQNKLKISKQNENSNLKRRLTSSHSLSSNSNIINNKPLNSKTNIQIEQTETISLCGLHPEVKNAYLSLDFVAKRMENRENYNKASKLQCNRKF